VWVVAGVQPWLIRRLVTEKMVETQLR